MIRCGVFSVNPLKPCSICGKEFRNLYARNAKTRSDGCKRKLNRRNMDAYQARQKAKKRAK